jgi:hypothetical protein
MLAILSDQDVVLFAFALFFVIVGLFGYFLYTFMGVYRRGAISPYSGMPLRHGRELTYEKKDRIFRFLTGISNYENRPFDFEKAAFCRETGRVFQDCVSWTGKIVLDWSFITKRYRGNFVSWGSLSPEKQKEIKQRHESLGGFQLEISSKNPSPRQVEDEIALTKPGPLYVDPETNVFVGWQIVSGTEFEVLIIQKPTIVKLLNINQDPYVKR